MIRFINKFDKRLIIDYLQYNLNSIKKYHISFEYLATKLPTNDLKDLNDCKWYEVKNYQYCLIEADDITIIIRQYQRHFTLFIKKVIKDSEYNNKEYGIVTFSVDTDKMTDDEWNEDYYVELNKAIPKIITLVRERDLHFLPNSVALPVEKYVNIQLALCDESIDNIDTYTFALEELFRLHFEIFCETEMVAKLKEFKIGDKFGTGVITNIRTEDFSYGNEPYYHGIGLEYKTDRENKFEDVYNLCRWHYDEVFGKETKEIRRKFLIKYKDTSHAISYNKGWLFLIYEHKLNGKNIYASTENIEIVKELLKVDFLDTDLVTIEEEIRIL